MAGSRVETTIAYKADARGLREIRQEFEKTFKPTTTRELNSALKDTKGLLSSLALEQRQLTTQLMGVKRGTDAYKLLGQSINAVNKEMSALRQTQGGLEKELGGKEGRRGGGFMSTAAGSAVGSYMGVRGARAAAMRGGGVFSGGGPLSTLFQGTPILGGLAAMAEGQVQSARAYEAAQLQAFPFLGGRDGLGGSIASARKSARDGVTMADVGSTRQERDIGLYQGMFKSDRVDLATSKGQRRGAGLMGGIAEERAEIQDVRLKKLEAMKEAAGGAAARGVVSAAIRSGRYESAGMKLGMGRTQSLQLAGQMGRQVGKDFSPEMFEQILGGQLSGVDQGTSARMFRQQRSGRGGKGDIDSLGRTIAIATVTGLKGSELNEHLSRLVGLQEKAEQDGLTVSTEGFNRLTAAFSVGGVGGLQGGRMASQFAGYGQSVSANGASGPVDIALLRAAGFNPNKPGSYLEAMERVEKVGEGGLSPEMLQSFVGNLTAGVEDRRTGSFILRRALKGKVTMGSELAGKVFDASRSGAGGEELDRLFEEARGKGAGGVSASLDGEVAGTLAAAARRQARLADQLLTAGQRIEPAVAMLNTKAAKLSTDLSGLGGVITKLEPILETGSKAIGDAITTIIDLLGQLVANAENDV